MAKRIIGYGLIGLVAFGLWYRYVPAINIYSTGFRNLIGLVLILMLMLEVALWLNKKEKENYGVDAHAITRFILQRSFILIPMAIIMVVIPVGNLFNGPLVRSDDYQNLITPEEMDFENDFPVISEESIPLIDRSTASNLGERQIGGLTDLVSQFTPASDYTHINIKEKAFRVTPLEYASFFTWWNNKDKGIPNYLKVDMVDGTVELVELEENMKYTHSERFNRNVKRHLRFKHPTKIFQNPSFEVDDEGQPHYIATVYKPKFFMRQNEPVGLIVLDAITGETEYYDLDEMPSWVDRVYSANLVRTQLNYNGMYGKGFWNSKFAKNNVKQVTSGYNYISIEDDVYLYTGTTSAQNDSSNIGFYLVNMRTKEASYYPVTSADEASAMKSAEGVVQEKGYVATFPLLINIGEKPMYILSLKDNSSLVRMYALIDPVNYQNVMIDETVDGLIRQLKGDKEIIQDPEVIEGEENATEPIPEVTDDELNEIAGSVENISSAVVSGDTIYYFLIDGSVYKANITLNDNLPFVQTDDQITGEVTENNEFRSIDLTQ